MRVEREDDRRTADTAGLFEKPGHDLGMAAMDAVEITDRHRPAANGTRQGVDFAVQLHTTSTIRIQNKQWAAKQELSTPPFVGSTASTVYIAAAKCGARPEASVMLFSVHRLVCSVIT